MIMAGGMQNFKWKTTEFSGESIQGLGNVFPMYMGFYCTLCFTTYSLWKLGRRDHGKT